MSGATARDHLPHGPLIGGIGIGVQQCHDDGVGTITVRPQHRGLDIGRIDRGLDAAILQRPFGDAVDALAWRQRRRAAREYVVGVGDLEACDLQHILEFACRKQG